MLVLGATYPTTTGEMQGDATTRLCAMWGDWMYAWRIYRSAGFPSTKYSSSIVMPLPGDMAVVWSCKGDAATRAAEIRSMWDDQPAAGRVGSEYWAWQHEPEQGPTSGDPTPAAFQSGWATVLSNVDNHARRDANWVGPIYTEYYASHNEATWRTNFGVVAQDPRVDFVGFDCYNIGYSTYRTPEDIFGLPVRFAQETGKRLIIPEYGLVRLANDSDGSQCATAIADHLAYLNDSGVCDLVCWWNNSTGTSNFNLEQRSAELAQLRTASGLYSTVEPDVDNVQYQLGYEKGWDAGRTEILNELETWIQAERS